LGTKPLPFFGLGKKSGFFSFSQKQTFQKSIYFTKSNFVVEHKLHFQGENSHGRTD
jgi:hypothetical protein